MDSRSFAVVLLAGAWALTCCGGGSSNSGVPEAVPPNGVSSLSLPDTARDLAAENTAETGVWSVAAHLRLSVFDIDGREVLHGSQPFADNTLYLYSFEIGLLSRLVNNGPDTWDQFAARLTAWNPAFALTGAQLQSVVTNFYAHQPDDYSGQMLKAMGVSLGGAGSLTSFDEWLIIVDPFLLNADQISLPGVGVASPTAGVELFARLGQSALTDQMLIELSHDVILAGVLVVHVAPVGPVDLDMGESGPGESVQFAVHVSLVKPSRGMYGVPSKGVLKSYGCLFSLPYGPVRAQVFWGAIGGLDSYGDFLPLSTHGLSPTAGFLGYSDDSGLAPKFAYQTHKDPGGGHGEPEVAQGSVAFAARPGPDSNPGCFANNKVVQIEYLDHAAIVDVHVHYHLPSYVVEILVAVNCNGLQGSIDIKGTLAGTTSSPDILKGNATYSVTGPKGFNIKSTTTLRGLLISDASTLTITTGAIGAFPTLGGGVLAGGLGPFTVPSQGGTATTPIQCGTAKVTATPAS